MQFTQRKHALRALKRYTNLRSEIAPGETISPAEAILIEAVYDGIMNKKMMNNKKHDRVWEGHFQKIKSIARCLGHYPVTKEMSDFVEVRRRMTKKISYLVGEKRAGEFKFYFDTQSMVGIETA